MSYAFQPSLFQHSVCFRSNICLNLSSHTLPTVAAKRYSLPTLLCVRSIFLGGKSFLQQRFLPSDNAAYSASPQTWTPWTSLSPPPTNQLCFFFIFFIQSNAPTQIHSQTQHFLPFKRDLWRIYMLFTQQPPPTRAPSSPFPHISVSLKSGISERGWKINFSNITFFFFFKVQSSSIILNVECEGQMVLRDYKRSPSYSQTFMHSHFWLLSYSRCLLR